MLLALRRKARGSEVKLQAQVQGHNSTGGVLIGGGQRPDLDLRARVLAELQAQALVDRLVELF